MIVKKVATKRSAAPKSRGLHARDLCDYIAGPNAGDKDEKVEHRGSLNLLNIDHQAQVAEIGELAETARRSAQPIQHWILSWRQGEQPTADQADGAVRNPLRQPRKQSPSVGPISIGQRLRRPRWTIGRPEGARFEECAPICGARRRGFDQVVSEAAWAGRGRGATRQRLGLCRGCDPSPCLRAREARCPALRCRAVSWHATRGRRGGRRPLRCSFKILGANRLSWPA